MSAQALAHVMHLGAGGFAQGVLFYLAAVHNGDTGQCNPSRETIRQIFHKRDKDGTILKECTMWRVENALKELREAGFIASRKVPCANGVQNWYTFPGLGEDSPKNLGNPKKQGNPNNLGDPSNWGNPKNFRGVTPKIGVTGNPNNWGGNKKENKKEEKDTPAAACASPISMPMGESVPNAEPYPVQNRTESKTEPGKEVNSVKKPTDSPEPFSLTGDKPKAKKRKAEIDRPEIVPEQSWADWKEARKSRRAGPITQTAWNLLCKEAAKAGITPAQAVELCAGRSWISFQANWLRDEDKPQKSQFEVSADRLADVDNRFAVKAVR